MGVEKAFFVLDAQTVAIAKIMAPLEKKFNEASLKGLGLGPDVDVTLDVVVLVISLPCALRIVKTEKAVVVMVKTKPIITVAITFRICTIQRTSG